MRGALRVATPYIRPQLGRLGLASGAAVLVVGCQLLAPWPLALAVDHALGGRPLTGPAHVLDGLSPSALLVVAGAALLVLTAVGGLLDLCTDVSAAQAAERMGGELRQSAMDRVLALSLRWHDRMRTGEIISRLTTDVGRVQDAVVVTFTSLIPDLLLLTGALVLLFLVDPFLAWLGLVVIPPLAWLSAVRRRRTRAAQLEARRADGRLTSVLTDLLHNVRAVQAFGRRDHAAALFREPNNASVAAEVRAATVSARWSPLLNLVLAAGSGIVLVTGGLQVLDGRLTVGQLLVVMAYLGDLQSPVRALVRLAGVRAKAAASAVRLKELLDSTEAVPEPAVPRPVPRVREGLTLESVRFSYSPDRPVLRDVDLTVAAGETVCLFGPSGAGKSTVLSLLLRLYDPDAGRVLIDGVDVRELSTVELRRQMAFVPQDPWLLDGTIAENIAYGNPDATRADVLAAGRAAWVDEFAISLPEGYDTPLGESGVMLSGGQRRRVALARAVVSSAPVVLLDEPTTSLDAESARQVIGAIRSATRDRTVVLVTHDPVLAAIADRTVPVTPLWWGGGAPAGTRELTLPQDSGPVDTGRDATGTGVQETAADPDRSAVPIGATQTGGR
jgi:ABC-type multidrug transport system fused ATPase/permease subunit